MEHFFSGKERRRIEDSIVARFRQVDFKQKLHAYLEQEVFWDFIFSWYELAHYYEQSGDNNIGAHMLDLYAECVTLFRVAAGDRALTERRRDKAADAIYQLGYYVQQMTFQARRNGIEAQSSAYGDIAWKPANEDDNPPPNLN